jgi:hypothetical protein
MRIFAREQGQLQRRRKLPQVKPVVKSDVTPRRTHPIEQLQRAIGNQAVIRLLSAKSVDSEERSLLKRAPQGKQADDYEVKLALWVLDDILDNKSSRLIPDVPDRYRDGLGNLYKALQGKSLDGKKEISGRERREIFDAVVLALKPVLASATESQRAFLQKKRTELFRAEAEDRIGNLALVDNKPVEIPDDRHPREQAELVRASLHKIVESLKIANEDLLRLGHEQLEEALHYLEKGGTGNVFSRLTQLQTLLGLADGWLALTDEELQHHITEIRGFIPRVATYGELVKAIVEIGGGAVSFTALLGAGIAKVAGDPQLAASALGVAGKAAHLVLGEVLSGIEIVHGIFVILDPKATTAQKERAGLGVASGSAWFIGGGPASFGVLANYLMLKLAAQLYWQGAIGINTLTMREAFEYMQGYGTTMARAADRLVGAVLLLKQEKNQSKAEALKQIEAETTQSLAIQIDDFLQHSLPNGPEMLSSKAHPGHVAPDIAAYPGNYTIFVEAFAPLQGLRSSKSGAPLAAAAAAVLEKITWCLTHAGEIVVAATRHQRFKDVEQEAAKPAKGGAE